MTPQQIDAMKLALEALTYIYTETTSDEDELIDQAITALEETLAEHAMRETQRLGQEIEQEPVAWRAPNWGHSDDEWVYRDFDDPVLIADGKPSPNNEPLYTNPLKRQWVGLTDEEIKEIVGPYGDIPIKGYTRKLFYQIEAKLEEKNT